MTAQIVGIKCGMTRIYDDEGGATPVTAIHFDRNVVVQLKNHETDGYKSAQVTYGTKKQNKVNKAEAGHYAKSSVEPGVGLFEIRLSEDDQFEIGQELKVDIFKEGDLVDVTGTSKGKGFQGGVKRHNFKTQDATHGNSLSHRAPGSIGQNQTPGRVFKGKKMAGQMGNVKCTVQTQEVVRVDVEKGIILVKGGVPGATGGYVTIKHAVKKAAPAA